jgi:hypothetical protein
MVYGSVRAALFVAMGLIHLTSSAVMRFTGFKPKNALRAFIWSLSVLSVLAETSTTRCNRKRSAA